MTWGFHQAITRLILEYLKISKQAFLFCNFTKINNNNNNNNNNDDDDDDDEQQQQQHKLYLHDYNYVVKVLQKL